VKAHLDALQSSAARLHTMVRPLDEQRLLGPAYPSEWSVADVLSHLGSGAVILQRRLEDTLAGLDAPDDFAPGVWDEWNAKAPVTQRDDALRADQEFVERLADLDRAQQDAFRFVLGPMTFDLSGFIDLRLNEHVLHTWDIEVSFDPSATLFPGATALVVDNLGMMAGYTGRPTGKEHQVTVRTDDPRRHFVIHLGVDSVRLEATGSDGPPDLELPAEAFVRLIYGRLDAAHCPETGGPADLDELRRVFPGA
jgi:uncharacterized protein (TIGR03083 family)